jgi:hypothetical protein
MARSDICGSAIAAAAPQFSQLLFFDAANSHLTIQCAWLSYPKLHLGCGLAGV